MKKEEWRFIPGFKNKYQASNYGGVRSMDYRGKKGSIHNMKQYLTEDGYFRVGLYLNGVQRGFFVHRLVALAFIPNPENKPLIDHINTIRTDNRVSNLRWVTSLENNLNPITRKKYSDTNLVSRIPFKKAIVQYSQKDRFIKEWPSCTEAGRELGINKGNIYTCCKNNKGSAGGYKWRFKNTEAA